MEAIVISGAVMASMGAAFVLQRALLGAMLYAIDPKRPSKPVNR